MRNVIVISIFFSLIIFAKFVNATDISLIENSTLESNLTPVYQSSLVAGDLNNDGKIDILAAGYDNTVSPKVKVYINNGTTLIENSTWDENLTAVYRGSVALGDIDNDGDLDLVLTGNNGSGGISKVYINNGTTLLENSTWESNLTDVDAYGSSISLNDMNNDGKLDLIIVGAGIESKNGIYINNGTCFVKNSSWLESLPKVGQTDLGTIAIGDYNSDGYLDIVFGGGFPGNIYFKAYTNNGSAINENFTWESNLFPGIGQSSFILGDVDNDGDLDLDIIGTGGIGDRQVFYINNGTNFVINQTSSSSPPLYNYYDGSNAFGDYNNDGYLDLASSGKEAGGRGTVYENRQISPFFQEDTIAETTFKSDDMQESSTLWTDIDNDGDLDLLSAGKHGDTSTILFKIYTNNITNQNNIPSPSTSSVNSSFNFSTGKLTLSWGNGFDVETLPLGLYYNLRVGTCSGCHDVVSGVHGGSSNPTSGYFGNMMQRKRIVLNRPDLENKTIYWAVQTIDTGLAKSAWSTEQVYHITQTCTENWSYGEWSSCVNNQQTRTASDLNNCGTTINRSAVVQSCSTTPSGGSPPGSSPPPSAPSQNNSNIFGNVTWYFDRIEAGVETGFSINETGLAVHQVWVNVRNEAVEVAIEVKKMLARPPFVRKEPEGKVYQYLNITKMNLSDSNVESGKIRFRVEKAWLENNKINESSVVLNRYSNTNNEWQKLKTELRSEDSGFAFYLAETPGFSIFAISGKSLNESAKVCVSEEIKCFGNELQECYENGTGWSTKEICDYGCENGKCKEKSAGPMGIFSYLWLLTIAVVVLIAVVFLFLKMKRTSHEGFLLA